MALKAHKVVAALPTTLEADAVYAVRVGEGFDLYLSDSTGSIAHKINIPEAIQGEPGEPGAPGQSITVVETTTDAAFDTAVASAPWYQITIRVQA